MRKGYERLLLGTLLASTIGDEIAQVALVFRIAPGGSGAEMASLLIALLVPGAIAASYAGKLVDERDAVVVLAIVSALQAVTSALLAAFTGPAATLVGAGLLSIFFAFSGAATFALIPVVSRAASLPVARVNAAMEFAGGGGAVFGPLIGGALVAFGGISVALLIDAATFAVLFFVVRLSRLTRVPDSSTSVSGWSPVAVARSYGSVARNRQVMLLLCSFWIVIAGLAVSDALYVFLVTLVLESGPFAYGTLIGAWATAYLAGAWVAAGRVERSPQRAAFMGAAAMAAAFLSIGLIGLAADALSIPVVTIAFLVGGFGNAIYNVAVRTILHTKVPAALHGRAAALYGTGTRAAEASGFLVGGFLGASRVLVAYTVSGVAALASALAGASRYRPNPPDEAR